MYRQQQNKNLWFVNPLITVWVPYPYLWVAVGTPSQYFLHNCKSNAVMSGHFDGMLACGRLHIPLNCASMIADTAATKHET